VSTHRQQTGCRRDERCILEPNHEGSCDWITWSGMPDPHRHNPFAVAVVVAVFFSGWLAVFAVVVLMIAGVLP